MHPWMLQEVAGEHRRDLLDQAGRWRLLHRPAAGSPRRVQVETSGWFRLSRRHKSVSSVARTAPALPSASASSAC
jgi:hypothetical protein